MIREICVGAAAILMTATVSIAGPEGRYALRGENPGGSGTYTGSVQVARTGPSTFSVTWKVGNDTFRGTAVGDDEFMAVGYVGSGNQGIALYVAKGAAWDGIWTYAGQAKIGTESWTPIR